MQKKKRKEEKKKKNKRSIIRIKKLPNVLYIYAPACTTSFLVKPILLFLSKLEKMQIKVSSLSIIGSVYV